ncbi:MAG TPA: flippase-like domain-containing protein [Candidatus Aminicenantes bacterium]|nr:flippase-like domain-containing protein [Candidatus Aminicenantes bacterium]
MGESMKRLLIRVFLPLAITALIAWFFFSHITLTDIKSAFARLPASAVLGFIALWLFGTWLRALKYRILIAHKLGMGEMLLITLVRNFAVDLLPARTASLAFYTALTKRRGLSLEEGGASFVISVFYDVLALSLMLGGLILFFPPPGPWRGFIITGMGILFLLSLILIIAPAPILRRLLNRPFIRSRTRLHKTALTLSTYLDAHTAGRERLQLLAISLAIRLAKYVSVFILFCALVPVERNPAAFSHFSLGLAGTEMSALLPIQGAGGFGTWEMAFELVFRGLGSSQADLRLTALVIHITTQAWEYSIGLLAFLALWLMGRAKANRQKANG